MRRRIASGLAATTAIAGVGATVVADTVAADAPGHRAEAPNPDPDLSTLEGCTAKFGLTKANSHPMLFDEIVSGPVTPAPSIGAGLTPVVTLTMADDSIEQCIPEPAWTDAASFAAWIDSAIPLGTVFVEQPELPLHLIPGIGSGFLGLVSVGGTPFPVKDVTLQFVLDEQYRADFTVTHPSAFDPSPWETEQAALGALLDAIRAGIDPSLHDEFDAIFDEASGECDNSTIASAELQAALRSLLPEGDAVDTFVDEALGSTGSACGWFIITAYAISADVQFDESTVEVRIESQGALPPTGGGNSAALLAGLLALAGTSIVLLGRRRTVG